MVADTRETRHTKTHKYVFRNFEYEEELKPSGRQYYKQE